MNTQNTHALFTSFTLMMCRAPGLSSAIVAPRTALQGTKCGTYIRKVAQAKVDVFMLSELFSQIKSAVLTGFEWSMSWNRGHSDCAGGGTAEEREYGS